MHKSTNTTDNAVHMASPTSAAGSLQIPDFMIRRQSSAGTTEKYVTSAVIPDNRYVSPRKASSVDCRYGVFTRSSKLPATVMLDVCRIV